MTSRLRDDDIHIRLDLGSRLTAIWRERSVWNISMGIFLWR